MASLAHVLSWSFEGGDAVPKPMCKGTSVVQMCQEGRQELQYLPTGHLKPVAEAGTRLRVSAIGLSFPKKWQ